MQPLILGKLYCYKKPLDMNYLSILPEPNINTFSRSKNLIILSKYDPFLVLEIKEFKEGNPYVKVLQGSDIGWIYINDPELNFVFWKP